MSMRAVTTQMDRDWYDAKERHQRRLEAMDGLHTPDKYRGCLPVGEHVHLNALARDTRACLMSEAEILDRIAELRGRIALVRETGFAVIYPEVAP